MLYKTLIRPIHTYGSECQPLSKTDGNMLQIFERRILRMIYGPIIKDGIWRTRYKYNIELHMLYDESDIIKVIKLGRLRWLGHLFRMQELDPCRKLTLQKPEATQHVGKLRLRWLKSVEEDLKNVGIRN
jgi:hypothetical protein